jgi:hypothetical protein
VGWSVRCAACGSCCNSAPILSLPEVFRHQHLFVGALGLRRVRRVRAGDGVGHGSAAFVASTADQAACKRIATDCLHPCPGEEHDLLLTPLGFEDPGVDRCPALGADARCAIHGRDKPSMCRSIPFDPLVPDRLQHLVLADRWGDSDDLGARCIARTSDPKRMSVQGTSVLDLDVRRSLAAARRALAADKRFWGAAVHAQIVEQLFAKQGGADRVPAKDFLVIPLTPVLQWLALVSKRCHERCLEYLDAQMLLCETSAQKCAGRKQSSLEASLARLRGFARANHVLRNVLLSSRPDPGPSAAGQNYGHVLGDEAPGRQGATRAHSRSYATEEQRGRPGWIGSQSMAGILTGGTRALAEEIEDWIEGARPEVSALLGGDRMP